MKNKYSDAATPLVVIVFFILLLMQAIPFLQGYRLTADDVAFHQSVMSGWSASWTFIKEGAFSQGRIVHFVDLPFSLLGSYYSDYFIFRLFYIALYFSNFVLIGLWAALFLFNRYSQHFIIFVAVVLITFHPLDYFHLAPNAYPFHVSLPVFLILVSRIGLWYLRFGGAPQSRVREFGLLLLFFVGLIFSEYGFLFGLSLVVSEFFARAVRNASNNTEFWHAIIQLLRDSFLLKDVLLVFLFLVLYIGFRFFFPSSYDGNRISSDLDIALFVKTLWGHIYGGTSIASFVRYDSLIVNNVINLRLKDAVVLVVVFLSTFYVSRQCLAGFISIKIFELNRSIIFVCGLFGLFIALFITSPIALTAKYQHWCGDINSCIFLDSRVSLFGVGLIIVALCFMTLTLKPSFNSKLVIFTSLVIAAIGATSYLNNKRIAIDMGDYTSAWDRGKKIACLSEDKRLNLPISQLVDPKRRVSYHPGFDIEYYWSQYLKEQKNIINCKESLQLSSFFPRMMLGQPLYFRAESEALAYLSSGWSSPESWGTWSDASTSVIFLPTDPKEVDSISIELNALISPSHAFQRIEVLVNGVSASSITVKESPATVKVKLPDVAKLDSFSGIKIEFLLPDAARPRDVGLGDDARNLAIGLLSITLR